MNQSLPLLAALALVALAGCSHEDRDANTPTTSPTSNTMQSQTYDSTVPYRFPMTDGTPRPDARAHDPRTDKGTYDFSDLVPVQQRAIPRDRSGFPAPNSSNPPLRVNELPSTP